MCGMCKCVNSGPVALVCHIPCNYPYDVKCYYAMLLAVILKMYSIIMPYSLQLFL